MKKITEFHIDDGDFEATTLSKQYTITGEKDAEFILQVFNSDQEFYDFATNSFSSIFTSTSSLQVEMESISFDGNIDFPANGSGDTYTILLLTPPDKDTILDFGHGENSYSTTITQLPNAQLTFTPSSATPLNYDASIPTVTSAASPISTSPIIKEIGWDIINKLHDSYGFGLRLIRQPLDTDWYFQTTAADHETTSASTHDSGSTSTALVLNNVDDLHIGMHVSEIESGSVTSTMPTITAINTDTLTVTLSAAQTWAITKDITFRAYGSNLIRETINVDLDFSNWNSDVETMTSAKQFKKRVRAIPSSGTSPAWKVIALDNTYGLTGGDIVRVKGLNVVNTSVNKIQSVVADADGTGGDGTITVQVAQTAALSVGTVLKFFGSGLAKGSRDQLQLNNNVTIKSYPSSNKIIYLDLDNFINIGTIS